MLNTEEDILNELKTKSNGFTMPVEDFVWDAIAKEIDPDPKDEPVVAWWWKISLSIITLFFLMLGFSIISWNEASVYSLDSNRKGLTEKMVDKNTGIGENSAFFERTELSMHPLSVPEDQSSSKNDFSNNVTINSSENLKERFTNKFNSDNVVFENSKEVIDDKQTETAGTDALIRGDLSRDALEEIPLPLVDNEKTVAENVPLDSITTVIEEEQVLRNSDPVLDSTLNETILVEKDTMGIEKEREEVKVEIVNKEKISKLSIITYGGIGQSFRTLRTGTHFDLISHKNDHEKASNSFEFGLTFSYDVSPRWLVRSGVGYKFYSDKYDFQHDVITHRTKNDYQYINIPITIGFNVLNLNKSRLTILGGAKANVLASAQSSWVDPLLLTAVSHSNSGDQTPFSTAALSLRLGLDYRLNLSKNLKVHIMPGFDRFVNSVYKRQTDISQKPYSFNLDLGLSYSF